MIPSFNEEGYLPSGIHPATLEEIAERFGKGSEDRMVLMEALHYAVELAIRIGVKRFVINGSFVTAKVNPVDVDCVALVERLRGIPEEEELQGGIPLVTVDLAPQRVFDRLVNSFFASDKDMVLKGMVELIW